MRHVDHGGHQRLIFAIIGHIMNKTLIDLEKVDMEFLQIGERRIARAKVIDGQLHPGLAELREFFQGLRAVIEQQALRHFDDDGLAGKADDVQPGQPGRRGLIGKKL